MPIEEIVELILWRQGGIEQTDEGGMRDAAQEIIQELRERGYLSLERLSADFRKAEDSQRVK